MTIVSQLLGGLALFLYGMGVMSDSLKSLAGNRLEHLLLKATKSRFIAFFLGLGVTSLIQSSSAVMVMLIGFADSGLLYFARTFFVIMGANVGTTVTAWLVSLNGLGGFFAFLKPIVLAPILAFFGVMLFMSKKKNRHNIGALTVGFAILIIGMDMMSGAVEFLEDTRLFESLLSSFSNPIVAVLFATLFTAVIQSSSATVGIVQALAFTGNITLSTAAALVVGANVGTCITGIIASWGRNTSARRVSFLQVLFNVFGAVIFLIFSVFIKEITVSAGFVDVAIIHTLFNLLTSVLIFPFYKKLIHFTEKTIK